MKPADTPYMDLALQQVDAFGAPLEDQSAEPDPRVGSILGPYKIFECIGDGGMGQVYRAEHVHLGRPAAIKFLLPRFAVDQEAVSRFLEEARTVNRVRHANLIDIHDYFVDHDRALVAYVMELLTGCALRDALVRGPLGLGRILPIARQIASALQAVHAVGIVHRDLKPENIYLIESPEGGEMVKVLDFGVAKFTRGHVTHKTQAGMAMGSPWYMAPEQARGAVVDHRADVYSFGVILYEMLTGRVPFGGESYATVLAGHLTKPPPPLRRPDGWMPPDAISGVVLRCLEKEPTARPHDMELAWQELAEAAGPQFAGSWATPAPLHVGRTPRPSRVTLPLTGSDSPFRYTPIEGAPTPRSVDSEQCLPVLAGAYSPDGSLPVAVPAAPVIEIDIEPSRDTAPSAFSVDVIRADASTPPRSMWKWAAVGVALGLGAVVWLAARQGSGRASPTGSATVAAQPPTGHANSAAQIEHAAARLAVAPLAEPMPSPTPPIAPPPPAAPTTAAPSAPTVESPPPTPSQPTPTVTSPTDGPRKPRKQARPTARPTTSPKEGPVRDARDVILDPFQ